MSTMPKQDGESFYTETQLKQTVQDALNGREFIHAQSSRIYAKLASAVQAGADDITLGRLLRAEMQTRLEAISF